MKVRAVGIDVAKNVFQIHCVDEQGKVLLRKQLKRSQVASFFANLSPCLIGMEAAVARITGRVSCNRSGIACG